MKWTVQLYLDTVGITFRLLVSMRLLNCTGIDWTLWTGLLGTFARGTFFSSKSMSNSACKSVSAKRKSTWHAQRRDLHKFSPRKILKLSFIHHHIYINLGTSKKKYIYWTSEIVVQTFILENYDLNTNFE